MKALIQRVKNASVEVNGQIVGAIDEGILLLLGVEKDDDQLVSDRMLKKILAYRIFDDENGRMGRSLADINGGLLVVSQFTLVADTKKGTKPSFSSAAPPEHGE
ncbi:D-tyrosyl-tRNA(Tyr) deacylase, partial [Oleiphilus sp. HI0009]